MARVSGRRIALVGADIISSFTRNSFANLGTAGTVIAIPSTTHSVRVIGTADCYFQVDSSAAAGSPALVKASTYPRFGLHQSAASVSVASVTGSANFELEFHKATDSA